jgi:hypothetical protein
LLTKKCAITFKFSKILLTNDFREKASLNYCNPFLKTIFKALTRVSTITILLEMLLLVTYRIKPILQLAIP